MASPGPRPRRWWALVAVVAVLAAAAAWLHYRPAGPSLPLPAGAAVPGCGFRFMTGADCPGCGMTRSLASLVRGDVAGSFAFHPVGPVLAALALAALGLAAAEGLTGRPLLRRAADRHGPRVAGWTLALLAICWLFRVFVRPDLAADPVVPGSPAARVLGR